MRKIPVDVTRWGRFQLLRDGNYCALGFVGKALGMSDDDLRRNDSYAVIRKRLGIPEEARQSTVDVSYANDSGYGNMRKELVRAAMAAIGCEPVFSDETDLDG